jgi:type VI protein secretion system component VasK
MPLLVLAFLGFVIATVLSVFWVAFWIIVALTWLLWPLALLAIGVLVLRAQSRRWVRWHAVSGNRAEERPSPFVRSSGNRAFDEYRDETVRRLDEERHMFREFVARLRRSKDKEEFDRYMADRRRPAIDNGATA